MALAGIDETRLRRAFLEEAEDLGQKLGERLLALESDLGNRDVVNEVFRLTHSLKSESALMGFTTLSELAHRMEDVLGLARDGRLVLERSTMDGLLAGSDLIGEMMTAIGKGQSDSDFDTARQLADLTVAMGGQASKTVAAPGENAAGARPPHAEAAQAGPAPATESPVLGELTRLQLAEARDRGETAYRLVIGVDEGEPMKFPRAFLVCSNLEATANVVASDPPMDGAPADDAPYARTTILVTTDGGEAVLRRAASVDQVTVIQVDACAWDTLLAAPPTRPPTAAQAGTPAGAAAQGGAVAPSEEQAHRAGPVEKTSIRVETRKLDDLWSYVAELVLHKSHIARLTDSLGKGVDVETAKEELTESFDALEKISSGMQQAMMDTRMIPISVIFSKFPRLVRDLSRKLGKPVELTMTGEDTEIDRSIVDALSDPLTHVIRNSLDHGIEFPEERVRSGKSETGHVVVAARRQGGNVVVELSDDGRGMDVETIRRTAARLGITGAESFTEAQLLELVFLPGFSTREVVTDVSGRGVGMDVVATRIRGDLKGDVVLRTEKGRGTRVTLLLPLTLTIVNALLVRGGTQLYAIPLTDVDSTAKIDAREITGDPGRESAPWQETEIPLYSLDGFFGSGLPKRDDHFALVVHHGDRQAYLVVDELIEEREIVIKPVDDLLNGARLFSGVSLLEDGRLVFILDTSFVRRENF